MKRKPSAKSSTKGFTLIELMIVVAIALILSAAAIVGGNSVLRSLRFNNAFNKTVMVIQEARNLAVTAKDLDMNFYTVKIATPLNGDHKTELTLTAEKNDGSTQTLDTFVLINTTNLTFYSSSPTTECANTIAVKFKNISGDAILQCDAASSASLKLGVKEMSDGTAAPREKSFLINQGAGVPQVD